jgi:carbon monoxide dehydrogenase subunit G
VNFEVVLAIAAPPEEVFDFLTDPTNLPRWQESCVAAESDGTRIHETRSFMGHRAQVETEIVERERPHTFTVRSLGGPVHFTVRHELSPSGEGTKLRVDVEFELRGGLGRVAGPLATRTAAKQFRSDFERLQQILQS